MIRTLLNSLYIRLDRPGCTHPNAQGDGGMCCYRRHRGRHSFTL